MGHSQHTEQVKSNYSMVDVSHFEMVTLLSVIRYPLKFVGKYICMQFLSFKYPQSLY
jgi:hypothetical protein